MTLLRGIAAALVLMVFCSLAALCQTQQPSADELLARLEKIWGGWQDYQYRAQTVVGGKTNELKYYFKSPDLVRIDTRRGQVTVQPNGDIRGRLGKGPFGSISRHIDRGDKRLKDDEGIPFYESSLPATLARLRDKMSHGGTAHVHEQADSVTLEVRSGDTSWTWVLNKQTLIPTESTMAVNGSPVEVTHYLDFRTNVGLKPDFFKF